MKRLLKKFLGLLLGKNPFATTKAIFATIPQILFGMILGLMIYNPTKYSLAGLIQSIFVDQAGYIEGRPWFYQPSYILLGIVLLLLAVLIRFKWQIARDELGFVLSFYAFAFLINWLIITMIVSFTGENPLSVVWVQWQLVPIIMGGLAMGATLPKVRRAHTGTITAGGGALSVEGIAGHDAHSHDENSSYNER